MSIERGPSPEETEIKQKATNSETERPVGGFDDLVANVKEEVKDIEIPEIDEATRQEQRRAEAREKIAPSQAEYQRIIQQEKFIEGGNFTMLRIKPSKM